MKDKIQCHPAFNPITAPILAGLLTASSTSAKCLQWCHQWWISWLLILDIVVSAPTFFLLCTYATWKLAGHHGGRIPPHHCTASNSSWYVLQHLAAIGEGAQWPWQQRALMPQYFLRNFIYYSCGRPRQQQQQRHQHYTEATLAQRQQQPHRQHRYNIGGDPPWIILFFWRQASAATTAASPALVQHWGDHNPLDYFIILLY